MKKVVSLALLAGLSFSAQAYNHPMRAYVGADYALVNLHYDQSDSEEVLSNDFQGATPYLGVLFNQYFGVELGYLMTQEKSKNNILGTTTSTKTQLEGYTADLVTQLPITSDSRFLVLGSAGVAHTVLKFKVTLPSTPETSEKINDTALRLGAGLQYQFTEELGLRAMFHYANADFKDADLSSGKITKYMLTSSVGLNYQF